MASIYLAEEAFELVSDMVFKISWDFVKRYRWVDFDEASAVATLAFMEAWIRFEPGRGYRFTTYSYQRIRGKLIDTFIKKESRSLEAKLSKEQLHDTHATKASDNKLRELSPSALAVYELLIAPPNDLALFLWARTQGREKPLTRQLRRRSLFKYLEWQLDWPFRTINAAFKELELYYA